MLLLTYHYGHLKVHLIRNDDQNGLLSFISDDGDPLPDLGNPAYPPTWDEMRKRLLNAGFTLE